MSFVTILTMQAAVVAAGDSKPVLCCAVNLSTLNQQDAATSCLHHYGCITNQEHSLKGKCVLERKDLSCMYLLTMTSRQYPYDS